MSRESELVRKLKGARPQRPLQVRPGMYRNPETLLRKTLMLLVAMFVGGALLLVCASAATAGEWSEGPQGPIYGEGCRWTTTPEGYRIWSCDRTTAVPSSPAPASPRCREVEVRDQAGSVIRIVEVCE